jgi:hypothetical protein
MEIDYSSTINEVSGGLGYYDMTGFVDDDDIKYSILYYNSKDSSSNVTPFDGMTNEDISISNPNDNINNHNNNNNDNDNVREKFPINLFIDTGIAYRNNDESDSDNSEIDAISSAGTPSSTNSQVLKPTASKYSDLASPMANQPIKEESEHDSGSSDDDDNDIVNFDDD